MHKMNNLEYFFIISELSADLLNKHFSRIRKLGDGIYRMKIGNKEIICELGVRLHVTKYIAEPEEPDKFVQKVSKELDNAKLLSLEQINKDRIVSFNFNKGKLIFEMFGKGNGILVPEKEIACAVKYESWAGREIKPGEVYKPPGTKPIDEIQLSDKYIIVSLMKLPLGKEYALEALERSGISEKMPGSSLSETEISRIEKEIAAIKESAKPYVFLEEGKPITFSLSKLSKYSTLECKTASTLSEAIDDYYAGLEQPSPELDKFLRRLEKQQEQLQSLLNKEKENKGKGDFIYEKYAEVEEILDLARASKYEEIERKFQGKINKKEKSVEVEIG